MNPRTIRGLCLLALPLAAAAACRRAPAPVHVAGRVVGSDGAPLPDVRVILEVSPRDAEEATAVERIETRTDAKGSFSIDFQGHWRRASYRLVARKSGFEELSLDDADSHRGPVTLTLVPSRPR